MDYYQLTIDRKSTRAFKEKEISASLLDEIKAYYGECKKLVPSIDTELKIIDPDHSPMMHGCVGYEDFLIDAPAYLLILSAKEDNYLENAGFIGEDMVLKLTDMGLDSCWVTVNEPERLAERLKLTGKMPAALIAFGYGKAEHEAGGRLDIVNMSNVSLKQRTGYIAPKLYISDAVYSEDMGFNENPALLDTYTDLYKGLISACCAPSFLNKQPYRFIIKGGKFILVSLPDDKTTDNDFHLNLGIVMLNFYRTLTQRSGVYTGWVLGEPDTKVDLPENGKVVGYFNI
jgi:nitroreductase